MANLKKSIEKNIERNKEKEKKDKRKESSIVSGFRIVYIILIILICIYFLGSLLQGNYKLNFKEVEISDSSIIAGQIFEKSDSEYYVILADFTKESYDDEIKALSSDVVIYSVDLASAMNKSVISDLSNKDAQSSTELKISDSTLIKIKDGKNIDYIEGKDNIKQYLSNIK